VWQQQDEKWAFMKFLVKLAKTVGSLCNFCKAGMGNGNLKKLKIVV
jgi:hypothetical protein